MNGSGTPARAAWNAFRGLLFDGTERISEIRLVRLPSITRGGAAAVAALCLASFFCAKKTETASSPTPASKIIARESSEPCTDEGHPYGQPASNDPGYCHNCAGERVGLATLPDVHFEVSCVPLEGTPEPTLPPPTPTRTATAPVSSVPTRTPTNTPTATPDVTTVYGMLEIPSDARAVSAFLMWDAGRMRCDCDKYQVQFTYSGSFAADYEGPFPPASDPGMRDGFVWPCDPPGLPFTGENCRATASSYSFAYRVHDSEGWSAPRVQTYSVSWLNSCPARVITVPPRSTPGL